MNLRSRTFPMQTANPVASRMQTPNSVASRMQTANPVASQEQSANSPVETLESLLPLHFDPSTPKSSLPFSDLCTALETISTNTNPRSTTNQIEILTQLFKRVVETAQMIPTNKENNLSLEIYLVLKMLMPDRDHKSVYGMKTPRLLKVISSVLRSQGRVDASAKIDQWLHNPVPQMKTVGSEGDSEAIIFTPELLIATVTSSLAKSGDASSGVVTLQDVGALCRSLSNAYFTINSDESDMVQSLENTQKEILVQATKYLTFKEWTVLTKILLKKVTLGVGPATVLACIPFIEAPLIFPRKYNIEQLAKLCVAGSKQKMSTDILSKVECGIPFIPMTCHSLKSPYMMKWLFSREDTLNKPLQPKDGRLLIHSSGEWFIPLNASKTNKRFVNIYNKELTRNPSKRRYILFLREIQKSGKLINASAARGLVIHHTLSEELGNKVLMLLRSVSGAVEQGVEIIDETVDYVVDEREDGDGEPMNLRKQSEVQEILRTICNDNVIYETLGGKYKLYASVASRKPKKSSDKIPRPIISSTNGVKTRSQNQAVTPKPARTQDLAIEDEKVIVQTKYDGDRLQAHIVDKDNVQLYTKWGKNVSELYSNVRDDLLHFSRQRAISPCILDGELIVINEAGNPLAWSDEKWRYNKKGEDELSLFDIAKMPSEELNVATIIYDDEEDEEENENITYVTKRGLQTWSGIGPHDQRNMKARFIKNCRLCFIIFDIIMYAGKHVHEKACIERFKMITSKEFQEGLQSIRHVQVIKNTRFINTISEFTELIHETVKNKEEGLILKDPNMEYTFGKSKCVQKFKISGPDINTLVCGAGSSLSKNPRIWGLLTCVLSSQGMDGRSGNMLVSYVRVESIEGDKPWKAMQIALSLPSKINKIQILTCNNKNPKIEIRSDLYLVQVQWHEGGNYTLKWIPKTSNEHHLSCELYVDRDLLKDIQWLFNPMECRFGLSLRGDLRPIERDDALNIIVPRHPVGRIEFAEFQMSTCDTTQSIDEKFDDANDVQTCIESYTVRRIRRLRELPPKRDILEEIRRTVIGISEHVNETTDPPKKVWPQPTPSASMTINEFSDLLQTVMEIFLKSQSHEHYEKMVRLAFRKLEPEARLVLAGATGYSQWTKYKVKNVNIGNIEDVNESTERARIQSSLPSLLARLRQLKEIQRPIISTASEFTNALFVPSVYSDESDDET